MVIRAINPYAFYEDMEQFVQGKMISRKYELGIMEDMWEDFLTAIRENRKPIDLIETEGK